MLSLSNVNNPDVPLMGCRGCRMMLEKARGAVGGETRASGARQEIEKREEGGRSGGARRGG